MGVERHRLRALREIEVHPETVLLGHEVRLLAGLRRQFVDLGPPLPVEDRLLANLTAELQHPEPDPVAVVRLGDVLFGLQQREMSLDGIGGTPEF